MKNVIIATVLAGFMGIANAEPCEQDADYINANMIWSDNEEFQEVNKVDYISGYGHEEEVEVVDED